MEHYVAIDAGKYNCKVSSYDPATQKVKKFKFKTKVSPGSFNDDAIEKNTCIIEYGGQVYKVGDGARKEAELETSKMSAIHLLDVITSLALLASSTEENNFHVAVGIPVQEWQDPDRRAEFKRYIMPEGEITVTLMQKSDMPPVTKSFHIVSRHVYPESQGALFLKKMLPQTDGTVAVVDIGSLNINCTVWTERELDHEYSMTDELGGRILISNLSKDLSARFSRVTENHVMQLLSGPLESRCLRPNRPNPEIEKRSAEVINEALRDHVMQIKRQCDAKHWSLDYMSLVFIGGTADILRNEIIDVFGEEVYIPRKPEYANCLGFLRVLCAKELKMVIPLGDIDEENEEDTLQNDVA